MIKKRKYRNTKVTFDGYVFDSIREAKRWKELKMLLAAGEITELRRQVKYTLLPKSDYFRSWTYTADFVYREGEKEVVEDAKGYPNDRWPLVKKMMYATHGILIREV